MKAKLRGSILAVGMAVMACAGVWADVPATQPTGSVSAGSVSTTRPSPLNLGQWRRAWALTAGRTAGIRPYTQEEWNDMMTFMRANSPARWRVLSSLQLRPNAPIRLDAIRRWRNFNFTKDHFPDVADQLVKRVRLEDDLFALTMDAQSSGEADSASIREKIRDKIAEIVNLDFSERQTRIDKLEKMLDDEKTRLAADQSSVDKIIDRRTDQIMNRLDGLNRELSSPTTRPTLTEEANDNEAAPNSAAAGNGAEVDVDSAVTSTPAQK